MTARPSPKPPPAQPPRHVSRRTAERALNAAAIVVAPMGLKPENAVPIVCDTAVALITGLDQRLGTTKHEADPE